MRRWVLLGLMVIAGCGSDDASVSTLCFEGPETIATALQGAPGDVALEDGTRLSDCVEDATNEAELQNVGAALTGVAEDLELRADEPRAALELGYLVGAARRGAGSDAAIQTELVRRLERSASAVSSVAAKRSLAQGLAAGAERG